MLHKVDLVRYFLQEHLVLVDTISPTTRVHLLDSEEHDLQRPATKHSEQITPGPHQETLLGGNSRLISQHDVVSLC